MNPFLTAKRKKNSATSLLDRAVLCFDLQAKHRHVITCLGFSDMFGYSGLHALNDGFGIGIWPAQNGQQTVGAELFVIRILRFVQAIGV